MQNNTAFSKALNAVLTVVVVFICIITLFLGFFSVSHKLKNTSGNGESLNESQSDKSSTGKAEEEEKIVKESTFTLSATGDILIHLPVLKAAAVSSGGYDFSSVFRYFSSYVGQADCAVANLETTLAGSDNGYEYNGYPNFNCPDNIVDSTKDAGFDLLLTANNHSYDTRSIGFHRTVDVIRDKKLLNLGTKADASEKNYLIVEENGISLGLLCYTYEDDGSLSGKAPNGLTMREDDTPLINSFDYSNLDYFYDEMNNNISQMKNEGADAVILFIHWGNEYQTTQSSTQSEMAQKLCDLGIDVIIGGHPHVVQPVELLTSSIDATHRTVCLYSMGNAVSNQRRHIMNLNTGHTEDGVLFSITFARYSDGTVILEKADLLPTWVNMTTSSSGKKSYVILPLEEGKDWKSAYDLSDSNADNAQDSYDRTMAIVGDGMEQVDTWLAQSVIETETKLGIRTDE